MRENKRLGLKKKQFKWRGSEQVKMRINSERLWLWLWTAEISN